MTALVTVTAPGDHLARPDNHPKGNTVSEPIGVSAVVRLRAQLREHPPGTYALVIGQAPHGRHRYQVMVPGDPLPFYPLASELEVVQGVAPQSWWKRSGGTTRD